MRLYLCVFVLALVAANKVCIIGGGIAGASCAYYLRNISSIDVVVLERSDRLGGRLYSVVIDGARVDVGGDAWTNANLNMMNLINELPIALSNDSYAGNGKSAVFDGVKLITTPRFDPVTDLKVLGALALLKFRLKQNYEATAGGFSSIEEYATVGVSDYLSSTARQWAQSENLDSFFTDFMFEPLTRVIYDQNLTMTLFAAMVSLLSTERSYSAADGNDSIVRKLLAKSGARVRLNSTVSLITDNDTIILDPNGHVLEDKCDVVIVAAPMEMTGLKLPSVVPRPFLHWWITITAADRFKPAYFGLSNETEIPDSIATPQNSTCPWTTCAVLAKGQRSQVYKCFSNVDISGSINQLFEGIIESTTHLFEATFPLMTPGLRFQPLNLSERLIYVGGMETIAVAMEGSVISGKNAALLAKRKLKAI